MVADPNKRTVLFVDDRAKRIDWAIQMYYENCNLIIAPNVPEALRFISNVEWKHGDIVSLDHDLNGHDFQDPDEKNCGMEIVRYLEKFLTKQMPRSVPEFLIHSSNKLASLKMLGKLRELGFIASYMEIKYEDK